MQGNLIVRFVFAVLITYIIAVVLVSNFNTQSVVALGVSVSTAERLSAVGQDLVGMLATYLPMIAVAFLIAFTFTKQILLRFLPYRAALYSLAGFVAIATVHIALKAAFEMNPVAPTATTLGFLSQCIAGGIGGWVFYRSGKAQHG